MEEDTKKKKNQFGWKYQLRMNVEYYIGYLFWVLKYFALIMGAVFLIVSVSTHSLVSLECIGISVGCFALYPLFNWISNKLMH